MNSMNRLARFSSSTGQKAIGQAVGASSEQAARKLLNVGRVDRSIRRTWCVPSELNARAADASSQSGGFRSGGLHFQPAKPTAKLFFFPLFRCQCHRRRFWPLALVRPMSMLCSLCVLCPRRSNRSNPAKRHPARVKHSLADNSVIAGSRHVLHSMHSAAARRCQAG